MIGIYKITNPNGKIYIGQSIHICKRKKEYKWKKAKGQPILENSIRKYGWESHMFEIIEECDLSQLNEREVFWKKYYLEQSNNDWKNVLFCELYDMGGGPRSEYVKNKLRKPKPEGHGEKVSRIKQGQIYDINNKVNQFTKDGILIKTWFSPSHIRRELDINYNSLNNCLRGEIKSCGGYIWKFEGIDDLSFNQTTHKSAKPIFQFNLDGMFMREWESIREAQNYYFPQKSKNHNGTHISNNINNRTNHAFGYVWKFKNP